MSLDRVKWTMGDCHDDRDGGHTVPKANRVQERLEGGRSGGERCAAVAGDGYGGGGSCEMTVRSARMWQRPCDHLHHTCIRRLV